MSDLSLKGLIPVVAKAVDMTAAALYERQRALVRAGLLQSEAGRGPGSGVRATPDSVALLLIALLATGSLSETEAQTKLMAKLKSETKYCPVTGKKTFATALAAILASEKMAKQVGWIEVERGGAKAHAIIGFKERPGDKSRVSGFGFEDARQSSRLSVRARLFFPFDLLARGLAEVKKRGGARQ
jgi:DNA-binding IscR family transcriptional regulator